MKLKKTFSQVDKSNHDQSSLTICVDYDPSERTVLSIEYVEVHDHKRKTTTDISCIMAECFGNELDSMIDNIDWWAEYRESLEYIEFERA